MKRRLVAIMATTTGVIIVTVLIPLTIWGRINTDDLREAARGEQVEAAVNEASSLAAFFDNQTPEDEIDDALRRFAIDNPDTCATVYGRDGSVAGDDKPANEFVDDAFLGQQVVQREADSITVYMPNNGPFGRDPSEFVIRVETPFDQLDPNNTQLVIVLVASTLGAAAVAAVAGAFAARSIAAPARRLTETARHLEAGDFEARATPEGPTELRELGHTMNHLAARIDQLLEAERETVADLAHRLRTPVTALHLEVEALPPSPESQDVLDRLYRLERTLNEIIREMRRPGARRSSERADIFEVVRERIGDWAEVAGDHDRSLELRPELPGDRDYVVALAQADLEAVVDALVDNALTHTPIGTTVVVGLAADGDEVQLAFEDDGPGFPAGESVVRGVSGVGSSGLGLDIVRRTVERVGGGFEMGRSGAGGARVSLTFPLLTTELPGQPSFDRRPPRR